jgi:hypothetical protein
MDIQLPELRKRFYTAFIESARPVFEPTGHYPLDIDFDRYIRDVYTESGDNGVDVGTEDNVEAFNKLGLEMSKPTFDLALKESVSLQIYILLEQVYSFDRIYGDEQEYYLALRLDLEAKILPVMKEKLKSDGGPDLWQLWLDTASSRADIVRWAAEDDEDDRSDTGNDFEDEDVDYEDSDAEQERARQADQREAQFIEVQKEEMDKRRPFVEFQELDTYYKSVLGDDYLEQKFRDTICHDEEEVIIGEYLQDSDNIIFQVKGESSEKMMFASRRSQVQRMLPLYECTVADSMSSFTGNVYISLANMGCPCVGVANYDALKMLIRSNCQIFQLRATGVIKGPVASHRVRYLGGMHVNDSHCQSGSEMYYYATFIPSHSV